MDELGFISGLHPALVHYPIAFLTYGLGCDLYTSLTHRRTSPFAEWTLVLGVAACLPSMITGWFAASEMVGDSSAGDALVRMHNIGAYAVFFAALVYTGLRFGEAHGEWRSPKLLKGVLALVLVACLVGAGLTGGKATRANAASTATEQATPSD